MSDTPQTRTIDDMLPPCFKRQEDGLYRVEGIVLAYHTEPGFVFARMVTKRNENDHYSYFYAFREDPGAIQSERKRVEMAMYATLMGISKDNALNIGFLGELLPLDFADWKVHDFSVRKILDEPYRGLRIQNSFLAKQ